MPLRLTSTPAFLQRFMKSCLLDYRDQFVVSCVDDILVYAKIFEDFMNHKKLTLRRLREKGVEMKASNHMLFQRYIAFLGTIILEIGYHLNPNLLLPLKKYLAAPSTNIGEIPSLLGLVGYFIQHLENFGRIEKSLFDLLKEQDINF